MQEPFLFRELASIFIHIIGLKREEGNQTAWFDFKPLGWVILPMDSQSERLFYFIKKF